MALLAAPAATLCLSLGVAPQQGGDAVMEKARDLGRQYVEAGRHCGEPDPRASSTVDELEIFATERQKRIVEELAGPDVPSWAGIYTHGDGLGMNVALYAAPKSGVVYHWHGCMGLYDINHGDVTEVASDRLKVKLAVDPSRNWRLYEVAAPRPIVSEEWCFASWGDREYLVPSSLMIAFCNAANSGRGVELTTFASRTLEGRNERRMLGEPLPQGLPRVPREYAPFLLVEPLAGSISAADPPLNSGTFNGGSPPKFQVAAEVSIGACDGLLPGMVLYVHEAAGRGEAEVVSTAEATSRVEFRFAIWDADRDVPKAGWKVSTRHPRAP